jgi:hypothetical protein
VGVETVKTVNIFTCTTPQLRPRYVLELSRFRFHSFAVRAFASVIPIAPWPVIAGQNGRTVDRGGSVPPSDADRSQGLPDTGKLPAPTTLWLRTIQLTGNVRQQYEPPAMRHARVKRTGKKV